MNARSGQGKETEMKEFREIAREISLREWIEATILVIVSIGVMYAMILMAI